MLLQLHNTINRSSFGSQRRAEQPPGGAVGEGKWTAIKQATTETPSIHGFKKHSYPANHHTMKGITLFFPIDIPRCCLPKCVFNVGLLL